MAEGEPFRLGVSTMMTEHWMTHDELEVIAASPVACIEVGPPSMLDATDSDVEAFVEAIQSLGLEVWSMHAPFSKGLDLSSSDGETRARTLEAIQEAFQLTRRMDGGIVVVHSSAMPIHDHERQERLRHAQASLARVADIAADAGLRAAIEPLSPGGLGEDSDEFAQLMADLPEEQVGICLDVNHVNIKNDLPRFVRRFGSRIITVHLADNDGDKEWHWLPGRGVIDWPALIGALRDVGYRGPWMLEVALGDHSLEERLEQFDKNRRELLQSAS